MDQELFLEVIRNGRRARYHVGVRTAAGLLLKPEQCNTDQAGGEVRLLEALPEYPEMRRPWRQLCRRCFRGTAVLQRADQLRERIANLARLTEVLEP